MKVVPWSDTIAATMVASLEILFKLFYHFIENGAVLEPMERPPV